VNRMILPMAAMLALAGCTTDDDADAPDEVDGADASAISGTITELDIGIPESLAAQDVTFELDALEVVGDDVIALGALAEPDTPAVPVVHHTSLTGVDDWEQRDPLLPDGYVTGSVTAVDDPDVLRVSHTSEDRDVHASLWTRTTDPEQLVLIDDADDLWVANVFAHEGDRYALGSVAGDTGRTPALWHVDGDDVDRIDLDHLDVNGSLRAGFIDDGTMRVFGVDHTTDRPFLLAGDTDGPLEMAELSGAFEDANRINTVVATDDAVWLGGSVTGSATGQQAVWSYSRDRFRDVSRDLWNDTARHSSEVRRLVVDPVADGEDFLFAADATITWWWWTRGPMVGDAGWFGGNAAAYHRDEDLALSYAYRDGDYLLENEPVETNLPPSRAVTGAPGVGTASSHGVMVRVGTSELLRSYLVQNGDTRFEIEGYAEVADLDDRTIVYGNRNDGDGPRAVLAEIGEDGNLSEHDLDVDDTDGQSRLAAPVLHDGVAAVWGHLWTDGDTVEFLGFEHDGDTWQAADAPDALEGHGVQAGCGDSTFTAFDASGRMSAGFIDGGVTLVDLPDPAAAEQFQRCDAQEDGTAFLATTRSLVRATPGGADDIGPDQIEAFAGVAVVDDIVLVAGRYHGQADTVAVLASDDGDDWDEVGTVDLPLGAQGVDVAGVDGADVIISARVGTTPRAWTITLDRD
jgi:hypothetical protein